jgi:MOSC domain-containing protein YiiM/DNA-binding HxlR family transcriptional regulator
MSTKIHELHIVGEDNPSYQILEDVLGCKWSAAVVAALGRGVHRPGELERFVSGISTKVLMERLHKLVEFQLVERSEHEGRVRHVEYRLTSVGMRLAGIVEQLRALESDHPRRLVERQDVDMRVISIQVGKPAQQGDVLTSMHKQQVMGPLLLSRGMPLPGDGQADLVHHGGEDKAVCVYPSEHHDHWQHELAVASFPHGGFGENFTTRGAVESGVCIGDQFRCGDVLFEVSQPRQPCFKLAKRWGQPDFAARVLTSGRTGWYLRILIGGQMSTGSTLTLSHRPHPQWTIAVANQLRFGAQQDPDAVAALVACEALSVSWRTALATRDTKPAHLA